MYPCIILLCCSLTCSCLSSFLFSSSSSFFHQALSSSLFYPRRWISPREKKKRTRDKDTPDDVAQKSLSTITTNQLLLQHPSSVYIQTDSSRSSRETELASVQSWWWWWGAPTRRSFSLPPPRVYYIQTGQEREREGETIQTGAQQWCGWLWHSSLVSPNNSSDCFMQEEEEEGEKKKNQRRMIRKMRKEEYNLNGHNKIRKRKNNSQNLKKF